MEELWRQGLSVTAISEITGFDRKTVRKYLAHPELERRYKPRPGQPSLLDPFKPYIEERLAAGVWNAVVLTRELRECNYTGGYPLVRQNATKTAPRKLSRGTRPPLVLNAASIRHFSTQNDHSEIRCTPVREP